jgi:beta-lactamase class A
MAGQRSRRPTLVFALAVVVTLVLLFTTNWSGNKDKSEAREPPSTSASHVSGLTIASPKSAIPTNSPSAIKAPTPPTAAQRRATATAQVTALDKGLASGSVSVAALNMATGASYSWGATSGMWTASVYKLFVLETLLVQNGGPLSGTTANEAIPMIENSDNTAGYELFLAAGGRPGLTAGAKSLGLKHTVPGHADPAFTITSAMDMITLLKNLVQPGPLTKASRAYVLNLMEQVEADQRWGVGVVADKGDDFANKNGWLSIDNTNGPGEDDNGLWAVNSVGVVTVHKQQVLMAVMTRHRPDFASGVTLVQNLAKAIVPVVAP